MRDLAFGDIITAMSDRIQEICEVALGLELWANTANNSPYKVYLEDDDSDICFRIWNSPPPAKPRDPSEGTGETSFYGPGLYGWMTRNHSLNNDFFALHERSKREIVMKLDNGGVSIIGIPPPIEDSEDSTKSSEMSSPVIYIPIQRIAMFGYFERLEVVDEPMLRESIIPPFGRAEKKPTKFLMMKAEVPIGFHSSSNLILNRGDFYTAAKELGKEMMYIILSSDDIDCFYRTLLKEIDDICQRLKIPASLKRANMEAATAAKPEIQATTTSTTVPSKQSTMNSPSPSPGALRTRRFNADLDSEAPPSVHRVVSR